jgi:hypothetical protein
MDSREAKLAVLDDLKKTMMREDAKRFKKKEEPTEEKEKKPKKVPIRIRLMQLEGK